MKLLYVTKLLPYGETEAFILPEVASHTAAGWDVWLAPTQTGRVVHAQAERLMARTIRSPLVSPAVLAGFLAELARRPAKVLGWGLTAARSGRLALKNLAVWPKGVWLGREARRRGFDHIHVHWASVPATLGMIAADIAGLPFSITAHRYDIAQGNLLPEKARRARFIRAIDRAGAEELKAQIGPGGPEPWLLHMGVRLQDRLAPRRSGALDAIRLVMAARFTEKKGHPVLFDALADLRARNLQSRVELFGSGPLEVSVREQAGGMGLSDQVSFKGVLSHEALLDRLASGAYDIAVLPSLTAQNQDKEGVPVFLMEAMAAGLPVVSTPNGGIGELAEGGACRLVPEGDAGALARAIADLAADPGERERLAVAGQRRVREAFEIEACMTRLRARIAGAPAGREDERTC
jgi:colanic acid/amylovoran biosynthesis glycosyltransferase